MKNLQNFVANWHFSFIKTEKPLHLLFNPMLSLLFQQDIDGIIGVKDELGNLSSTFTFYKADETEMHLTIRQLKDENLKCPYEIAIVTGNTSVTTMRSDSEKELANAVFIFLTGLRVLSIPQT